MYLVGRKYIYEHMRNYIGIHFISGVMDDAGSRMCVLALSYLWVEGLVNYVQTQGGWNGN